MKNIFNHISMVAPVFDAIANGFLDFMPAGKFKEVDNIEG